MMTMLVSLFGYAFTVIVPALAAIGGFVAGSLAFLSLRSRPEKWT